MVNTLAKKSWIYWGLVWAFAIAAVIFSFIDTKFVTEEYGVETPADQIFAIIAWTGIFAFLLFLFFNISGLWRVFRAYRAELIKTSRYLHVYITFALIVIAIPFVVWFSEFFANMFGGAGNTLNGYGRAVIAVFAFQMILPYFIIGFTCSTMAYEASGGTLTTSLIRPIERWQFLFGKVLIIFTFAATCLLLTMGVALVAGSQFAPLGDIVVDGIVQTKAAEAYQVLFIYLLMQLIMLMAVAAFSFFVSSLMNNTVGSFVLTIVVYSTLTVVGLLFEDYIFSNAASFANSEALKMATAHSYSWMPKILKSIYICISYMFLFFGVSGLIFNRRNIFGKA